MNGVTGKLKSIFLIYQHRNPVPATYWTANLKIIIVHCFDEYSTPHGLPCASVIASSHIEMIEESSI